jgi:DNA mismatch repair ATPase MutS
MKTFLMHHDLDFDPKASLPPNAEALIQDLELNTLFTAMAKGDPFIFEIAKSAVLLSLDDPETIKYRQRILTDAIEHEGVVREIYGLAVDAIAGRKKIWGWSMEYPESVLRNSVETLDLFFEMLKRLRGIADENIGRFQSEGFVRLFKMLVTELDDGYLLKIQEHLTELKFQDGERMSARLGKGLRGEGYVLRRFSAGRQSLMQRVLRRKSKYSFEVAPEDESGHRELEELRVSGIRLVARALRQSTDHILGFFTTLRTELAFYVGCLNLRGQLSLKGEPTCVPAPLHSGGLELSAKGLYDVCLALKIQGRVVANDLTADGKRLVVITGANQGGKSTFLRSLGLAYIMTQSGMFVPADEFSVSVSAGVFTHYKREEDVTMKSGKFDEELGRMSGIVDRLRPGCILLCNESFSSTNEREGSEIGKEVIGALLEGDVRVFFVTHLFELAQGFYRERPSQALFLRAERKADGLRTFRIIEGEPLPTSYGQDLYRQVFVAAEQPAPSIPPGVRP